MLNHPYRVCFLALKAYGLLGARRDIRQIGGAEVQQTLIARGLQARGHQISFITFDHGQSDGQVLDGIQVFRAYDPHVGQRFLRYITPRMTSVWAAMRRADADVYFQRTSDPLCGIAAAFCRWHHRTFVYSLGHDYDCDPKLPLCPTLRERIPYVYGLRAAASVVAQTAAQQAALRTHFGIDAVVIPSCAPGAQVRAEVCRRPRARLLWIGRFAPEKRFGVLLDLAERVPEIDFEVVGDGAENEEVRVLKQRAARLANVALRGYVPHAEVDRYYRSVDALLNTSAAEGFPNTFLESWSRGVPVITTCDPDGIVRRFELGKSANTLDELVVATRALCFDEALRKRCALNAYRHFQTRHQVEAVAEAYERLFTKVLTHRAPQRALNGKLHRDALPCAE